MKWLGYKQVPVKSVIVPAAEIKARTKHPHVAELAASATGLDYELLGCADGAKMLATCSRSTCRS